MTSHGRSDAVPLGELIVEAGPDAPHAARVAVSGWLGGRVAPRDVADAQLIVSELVTNSVVHADAPADASICISAESGDGVLRLAVGDAGVDRAISMRTPELGRSGLGLHVLDEIARRWGVQRSSGTLVWFELADGV